MYVEVNVERIHHLTRRDEIVFSDIRGRRRSIDRDEWQQILRDGEKVWGIPGEDNNVSHTPEGRMRSGYQDMEILTSRFEPPIYCWSCYPNAVRFDD
jgi:hypothetical protein